MIINHWLRFLSTDDPPRVRGSASARRRRYSRHREVRMALEKLEDRTLLATFTVNTTADTVDMDPDTTSLREAILESNALPGADEIHFDIPGAGPHTISPTSPLPTIIDAVVIDGYTQPGSAEATATTPAVLQIELDGSNVGGTTGLNITAGDSTVRGLAINRFNTAINLTTAGGNVIEGNHIGTDVTGLISLPNNARGIAISSGDNLIGTDGDGMGDAGERNVIAGQAPMGVGVGIAISGAAATNNVVAGNYIGTDATGTAALGTGTGLQGGIGISDGAQNNLIGTDGDGVADDAERNIISGHAGGGIAVHALTGGDTANNVVAGNYIGTDVTGTMAIGNGTHGVTIAFGAMANLIGTDADGMADDAERNLIAGNGLNVQIAGVAHNNVVAGNYIGTDVTGTMPLGDNQIGVFIHTDADDNAAEGNLISGNAMAGVSIQGSATTTGNVVSGNLIGTDATGAAALANGIGVLIDAQNSEIGSPALVERNTIAFNTGAGVAVVGDAAVGNSIRGNSIHTNGGLGIDLVNDGPTANDMGDADMGPNNLQNFPVLTSVQAGPNTQVVGTLDSAPDTTFTIDVYANTVPDPSGFGEGEIYIGTFEVTTDMNGDASFDEVLAFQTAAGLFISSTATDPNGNTSEFSMNVIAEIGAEGIFVDVNNNGVVDNGDIDVTAEASDGIFDTDVSEGTYVAMDGVGLIVNQAITVPEIDYRADGLVTINVDLTSTVDDLKIVSRFSSVLVLNGPTLTSADDVIIKAAGNVDLDDDTVVAADDVEVAAGGNISVNGATITAGDDVELEARGDVNADGVVITAGDDVEVEVRGSFNGQTVEIIAGDDVEIEAKTGDINIPGPNFESVVLAGDDIELEAHKGDINAQEAVFEAVDDIQFTAAGSLHLENISAGIFTVFVAGDDVELKAKGGNVEAGDAFVAEAGGDVKVSARGSINAAGFEIHAMGDIVFHAETGDVNMPNSPNFTTFLEAGDDVEITAKKGSVDLNEAVLIAGDDVEVNARGSISAAGIDIVAGDDVELFAKTGDINVANSPNFGTLVEAGGDIDVEADKGSINADGATLLAGFDIELEAHAAVSVNGAVLDAGDDVELEANRGDLNADAAVIVAADSVEIEARGNVNAAGIVILANKDVEIEANNGHILLAGMGTFVESVNGDIEIEADAGMIDAQQGTYTAGKDFEMEAGGSLLVSDAIISAVFDVELTSKEGDVNADGAQIAAGQDVEVSAFGSISAVGISVIAGRDVHFRAKNGDIDVASMDTSVVAGRDIAMRAAGNVFAQNSTLTAGDDVRLTAGIDVDVQMAIVTAGDDIVLSAGDEVFVQDAVLTAGGEIIINGTLVGVAVPPCPIC